MGRAKDEPVNDFIEKYLEIKKKLLEKEFSNLNNQQKKAVFNINGPQMILAGAGSGKTTVIVNRIVNMINFGDAYNTKKIPENLCETTVNSLLDGYKNGEMAQKFKNIISVNPVAPENIVAITFTNKAANELKSRISSTLNGMSSRVWASTFHALCVKILRKHATVLGYSNDFAVYDSDDTCKLIKDCQKVLKIDDKMLSVKSIASEISRAKNKLLTPKEFSETAQSDFRLSKISDAYFMYQSMLKKANAMDFDDLIMNTIEVFKNDKKVLAEYQNQFKYILVDEYQDTNYSQDILIKMIAEKHKNLCIVGDDDQSIYKFRGANVENMINFNKSYNGAKIIKLEQNYRSTKNILNAANSVIEKNGFRKAKNLWTENSDGDIIGLHTAYSEHDEVNYIVETIRNEVQNGRKYSDFAILYRKNSQSNVIEKIFSRSGIPYRIFGGTRFYERQEIKDIISYMSVVNNPLDEVRLRRIINQPRRSIGERTIFQVIETSISEKKSLLEIMREASSYENLHRVAFKLQSFANIIDDFLFEYKSKKLKVHEIYQMIVDKIGYIDYLKSENDNAASRIENVKELLSNILKYEEEKGEDASLSGFLEEIALVSDIDNFDENANAIVMMTLHAAKGLEFPVVFMPGFEEGIFPSVHSIYEEDSIDEERRLAYVGITRAKEKLYILNADSRMIFGITSHNKLSRFVYDIPENLICKTKSRDWKKLDPNAETPRSSFEVRKSSTLSARNFGQTAGGNKNINKNIGNFDNGMSVVHKIFGKGIILSNENNFLKIEFEKAGVKNLMPQFVSLNT